MERKRSLTPLLKNWSFVFVLCLLNVGFSPLVEGGLFWQITDIHWDPRYSPTGDPLQMCHNTSSPQQHNGYFGNYSCDAPEILVMSAIEAMAKLQPQADFILWTGDSIPHVSDPQPDWTSIYSSLLNITDFLQQHFPHTHLLPVLGNHDVYPQNEFTPDNSVLYSSYVTKGGWNKIMSKEAQRTFIHCGFYSVQVERQLRILILNTNLYNADNKLGTGQPDPCGQFAWTRDELEKARNAEIKVLVVAHIPPGFFERHPVSQFFNETYNNAYIDLMTSYGDVIMAHLYGHEHTDSFKLFLENKANVRGIAFLCPSVTPWLYVGGVNPSVRLYAYDTQDGCVMDYWQYFLNLTRANGKIEMNNEEVSFVKGETDEDLIQNGTLCIDASANGTVMSDEREICKQGIASHETLQVNNHAAARDLPASTCVAITVGNACWELLYQATSAFAVSSLDAASMTQFYIKMLKNSTYFQEYYYHNTVGNNNGECNSQCKKEHLCTIAYLKKIDLFNCNSTENMREIVTNLENIGVHGTTSTMGTFTKEPLYSSSHFQNGNKMVQGILISIVAVAVIAVFTFAIVFARHKKMFQGRHRSRFTDNNFSNMYEGYSRL